MLSDAGIGAAGPIELEILTRWQGEPMGAAESPEVQSSADRSDFSGRLGEAADAFPAAAPRALIIGLGEKASFNPDAARAAAAAAIRRAARIGLRQALFRAPASVDGSMIGRALGEAAGLLAWNLDDFRSEPERRPSLRLSAAEPETEASMRRGLALAEAANLARTLAATPPNIATPDWLAVQAERLAADFGLDARILRGGALERHGMTGLLTVGRASVNPPCLIRLEWRPEGAEGAPVVLLGKAITFDTGGYSLKGKTAMPGMKGDKAGGCAVLGAMQAVAEVIRPSFPVVGLLVAAENSVSGAAYRPDDVIRFRNGLTVEVTNTDAEGRLVLADGLIWAAEEEKAACIVDLATLTGGVVTALGSACAGYFCDDSGLAEALYQAGETTGERIWRLPILPAHEEMMKSPIADLVNSCLNGKAHPIQGAAFLKRFAPAGTPWAHIDIAGTAKTDDDLGALIPGPTGFGARLLAEWIEQRAK
jgi:leucyl aminopeptidase